MSWPGKLARRLAAWLRGRRLGDDLEEEMRLPARRASLVDPMVALRHA
jgi:hypothetical protein